MYDLVAADISLGGDDDHAGNDDMGLDIANGDDIAVGGRGRRPRGKVRLARVQPVNQVQPVNFPQGPNGTTAVTAGATSILTCRPQRVTQVKRFVVPSFIAPFFAIGDLVVGRDSMFGNAEFASAEIFAQNGVGVGLSGFIARPGIDITLTVRNLDTVDHAFYGSLVNDSLV